MPQARLSPCCRGLAAALALVAWPLFTMAQGLTPPKLDPQGKDELWDLTVKVEMAGMPMAMPARTNRVCIEKGKDEAYVPTGGDDCQVTDLRRIGNKMSYKLVCTGKNAMTGSGEMTFSGDGYDGKLRLTGKAEGQSMDMMQTMTGRRLGNCTSTVKQDVAAMKAQNDKMIADTCRDGMDKLQWMLFLAEPKAACQAQRNEFCAAVGRAAQAMQDPAQYVAVTGKNADVKTSFAKCGQDFAATTRRACGRAAETRNWRFVGGGNCDAEVQSLGKTYCGGRGDSPDPQYYALCSRYATISRGPAAANAPAAQGTAPARTPASQDPVQQGIESVRKLFPF